MSKYCKSAFDDVKSLSNFELEVDTSSLPTILKEEVETKEVVIPKPVLNINRHMKSDNVAVSEDGHITSRNDVAENVIIHGDDALEIDHSFYRMDKEYVQLCHRGFSCGVPIYALELLTDSGYYNYHIGKEAVDASNELDRRKLTVIQIVEHVFNGVNIHIINPPDIVTILQLVERALNIYVGAIPIHHDSFMIPTMWFEKFTYYRDLVLANRPGLINKIERVEVDTNKVSIPRRL